MLHPDCRRVADHICMKNATTDLVSRFCAMAKPNIHQTQEQNSVADNAATLRSERKTAMQEAALRASETHSPQVSPSTTPLKKDSNSWENPNGNLSEPVREQLNAPEAGVQPSSKATLQDVQNIGQSLQSQGVTSNEVSQANSKAQIENSFDSSRGTGFTSNQASKPLSETERVTAQARQSVQKDSNSQSQSIEWER